MKRRFLERQDADTASTTTSWLAVLELKVLQHCQLHQKRSCIRRSCSGAVLRVMGGMIIGITSLRSNPISTVSAPVAKGYLQTLRHSHNTETISLPNASALMFDHLLHSVSHPYPQIWRIPSLWLDAFPSLLGLPARSRFLRPSTRA